MTSFNKHIFHVHINQSEVEDSLQLASDWIKPVRKNVNKLKAVTVLGSLLKTPIPYSIIFSLTGVLVLFLLRQN